MSNGTNGANIGFEKKLWIAADKLAEQFVKGKEIEDEIKKNLAGIGWEF